MRIQRSAAVAASLALAALPILASGIAAGGNPPASAERAEHARVVAFWTPARVRAAIPRDFAFDSARGYHIVPNARPGSGGGITGASWPNGTGKVYTATGKVLFTMGGSQYVCSGTALSNSRGGADGVVLTAGHCAYDETKNGALNGFATNWMFVPQFDSNPTFSCGSTAFGCWTAKALVVNNGYASAGGFNNQAVRFDWAFAVVGGGGFDADDNFDLDASVGNFSHQASEMALNTVASAFGYPAAQKYHGSDLVYCQGPTTRDTNPGTNNYRLACGMTGGSSGGPWFSGFDATGNAGVVRSLNSYGYSGQSNMYGPIFNNSTTQTFNGANSASTNTIVN